MHVCIIHSEMEIDRDLKSRDKDAIKYEAPSLYKLYENCCSYCMCVHLELQFYIYINKVQICLVLRYIIWSFQNSDKRWVYWRSKINVSTGPCACVCAKNHTI